LGGHAGKPGTRRFFAPYKILRSPDVAPVRTAPGSLGHRHGCLFKLEEKTRMASPNRGRLWPAVSLALLIGGCEALSKPESTHFEPESDGFEFRAIADAAYPEDSAGGEAWRMKWLEQRLKRSGTCPTGYEITSRKPRLVTQGALAPIYDVYYVGRCRG
jgi:hypothetical protein